MPWVLITCVVYLFFLVSDMDAFPRVESLGKGVKGKPVSSLMDKLSAGEPASEGEIGSRRDGTLIVQSV